MKGKAFLSSILIVSACFLSSGIFPQTVRYFYNGSAINLYSDHKRVLFVFNPDSAFKNNRTTFLKLQDVQSIVVTEGTEDLLDAQITFSKDQTDLNLLMNDLGLNSCDLQWVSYGYTCGDGSKIWPLNEVLFKLYNGFHVSDIQTILNKYNVKFIETDKYDVSSVIVDSAGEEFALAEELWLSGMVEFAEPDMYMETEWLNDPLYPEQYYLNNTGQIIDNVAATSDIDIDAPQAWSVTKGVPAITAGQKARSNVMANQ